MCHRRHRMNCLRMTTRSAACAGGPFLAVESAPFPAPMASTPSKHRSVLHLDADFDAGWSAHARPSHGISQIGIGGEGVSFVDRGEPVQPRNLVRIVGIPK